MEREKDRSRKDRSILGAVRLPFRRGRREGRPRRAYLDERAHPSGSGSRERGIEKGGRERAFERVSALKKKKGAREKREGERNPLLPPALGREGERERRR
jgi:hypothetical protein